LVVAEDIIVRQHNLPADVSLCLFRVTQETLRNIAKHSYAANIDIELDGHSDLVYLSISDDVKVEGTDGAITKL